MKNKLLLTIATITILTAGLIYGDLVTTNYLAEDTAIIENSNFISANENTIIIGTFTTLRRGLLKAANPDVPGGYEITNATLHIYQDTYGGGASVGLYSMLTTWDEYHANWTNRTSSGTWSVPGMAADVDYNSTIAASATASGWTTFDVTGEILTFNDKTATNYGWFLKRDNEAGFTRFRTVDGRNPKTQWPYLKLDYRALSEPAEYITNAISGDTFIQSANPNSTAGAGTTMLMGNLSGVYRGLIKSEINNIPSNATILSADLRVYQDYANGENNSVDIHRMLTDWSEAKASWNSNTVSTAWSTPGLAAGTDYKAVATDTSYMPLDEYVPFDVTEDIKAFHNGTADNYGWFLINQRESNSTDLTRFRTKEAIANWQPSLVIRYHVLQGTVIIVQ